MQAIVPPLLQNYFGLIRYNGIPYTTASLSAPQYADAVFPSVRVHDFFRFCFRIASLRVTVKMELLQEGFIYTADQSVVLPRRRITTSTFNASEFSPPTGQGTSVRIRQLITGFPVTPAASALCTAQAVSAPGQIPIPPFSQDFSVILSYDAPGQGGDTRLYLNPQTSRYVVAGLQVQTTLAEYAIAGRFLGSDYFTGTPPAGKGYQGRVTVDFDFVPSAPDLDF